MEQMEGGSHVVRVRNKVDSKGEQGPAVRMTSAPGALCLVPACLHRIKGPGNRIPTERRTQRAAPLRERGRLVPLREQEMLKPRR